MKMHLLFSLMLNTFVFSSAHATSFNIQPFSEFTQAAPNVVRGIVSNVHAENAVTNDGGKTIYTYANVAVKEVFKGNLKSSNITVRKLGGTKDGTTLDIPSSPEFVENEDTVLFLSAEKEDKSYEVMGLELGKFGVEDKNGDTFLTGGMFNYTQEKDHPDHPGETQTNHAENQKPWSLTQLRELIRKQNGSPASKSASTPAPQANAGSPSIQANDESNLNEVETPPTSEAEPEEKSFAIYYWIGGLILAAVIFFIFKRK